MDFLYSKHSGSQTKLVIEKEGRKRKILEEEVVVKKEKQPLAEIKKEKETKLSFLNDDDDEVYGYVEPPVVHTAMTEKYRPQKVSEMKGHAKAVEMLRTWLHKKMNKESNIPPVVILHGPAGIGKTTLAHAVLRERGFEICECNASDSRTVAIIVQRIREVCEQSAIDLTGTLHQPKKTALIIDEIDGLYGGETDDSESKCGSIHGLVRFLTAGDSKLGKMKTNASPIIMICNNISKIKELRDIAEVVAMYPLQENDIVMIISSIAQREKVSLSMQEIRDLAKASNGDARQALANLHLQKVGKGTNGSKTIQMTSFQVTQRLLYEKEDAARKAVEPLVASEYSYIEPLTFENYPSTFLPKGKKTLIQDLDEMVRMADRFSELDTMNTFVQNHPAMDSDGSFGARGMEPICAPILQASMKPSSSRATFDFSKQGFGNQPPRLETAKFFENRNKVQDKASQLREVESILPPLFRGLSFADMQDMSMVGKHSDPLYQKQLSHTIETQIRAMHADGFETQEETEEQIKVMTIKVMNHLIPPKVPPPHPKKWKK